MKRHSSSGFSQRAKHLISWISKSASDHHNPTTMFYCHYNVLFLQLVVSWQMIRNTKRPKKLQNNNQNIFSKAVRVSSYYREGTRVREGWTGLPYLTWFTPKNFRFHSNDVDVLTEDGKQSCNVSQVYWNEHHPMTQNACTPYAPAHSTEPMTGFKANHHYSVTRLIWFHWQQGPQVMYYAALLDWEAKHKKVVAVTSELTNGIGPVTTLRLQRCEKVSRSHHQTR